jgi:hypothetical protein
MKSENEIREKIEEYMDKLSAHKHNSFVIGGDKETVGEYYGIIDALLWVIGDRSGAPI